MPSTKLTSKFAAQHGPWSGWISNSACALLLEQHEAKLWADEPDVVLEVGKQYLFKGKFVRSSDTGFNDERGVLQFTAYRDDAGEWVYPKGSAWNPEVAAWQAEQEAAMLERMMKDSRPGK